MFVPLNLLEPQKFNYPNRTCKRLNIDAKSLSLTLCAIKLIGLVSIIYRIIYRDSLSAAVGVR